MTFFIHYLVQPLLVGTYTFTKAFLVDRRLPMSPIALLDVATHVFAKFVSVTLVEEMIVPFTHQYATWVEPLIHGGIVGGIKRNFIDTSSAATARMLGAAVEGVPSIQYFSFESGFIEGSTISLLAKITTYPFE